MLAAEANERQDEIAEFLILRREISPRDPGGFIVLAIGVVVATLSVAAFVAPSSIGTPSDSSKLARRFRFCRLRNARISGSSVSPSIPQFQEKFASCPSRLPSPFASLFLSL